MTTLLVSLLQPVDINVASTSTQGSGLARRARTPTSTPSITTAGHTSSTRCCSTC